MSASNSSPLTEGHSRVPGPSLIPFVCGVLFGFYCVEDQSEVGPVETLTDLAADAIWGFSRLAAIDFGGVHRVMLGGRRHISHQYRPPSPLVRRSTAAQPLCGIAPYAPQQSAG